MRANRQGVLRLLQVGLQLLQLSIVTTPYLSTLSSDRRCFQGLGPSKAGSMVRSDLRRMERFEI